MNTQTSVVGWMASQWKPYRRMLPVILGLTLLNAAVTVVYPLLLKRIIDGIERGFTTQALLRNIGFLILYGVAHFVVYACMQYSRARQNLRFEFSVRIRLFEYLLDMGQEFYTKYRSGDLVTRLTDDVNEKLAWFLCSGIGRVIEALSIIVFGVAMMLSINPWLTLVTAGQLPILIGLFVLTARKLHERYTEVQKSISRLNDSLESCFSGIRVVKGFAAEPVQRALVERAIDQQREAEIRSVRWQTIIDSFYGNVWQLAIIGTLLAGGLMVIQGKITLGDFVAFEAFVLMLVFPMFDIGQFLVRGKISAVSVERLQELEFDPPQIRYPEQHGLHTRHVDAPLPEDYPRRNDLPQSLEIEFQHVTYRYPAAASPVLTDVSWKARPGEITALVGGVGAGKSTSLLLIPRIMDPDSGRVLINQQDLRKWDLVSLRQMIGYVPQEASLFSGTIRENILFGRDWVTEEDLQFAIELAHLEQDLKVWPEGLETVAGSRGVRLSGGQKQRVSLARAIAGRSSILLLDDCTASLDARTESIVWDRLLESMPTCTIVLVTHRPSTLERASRIYVLEDGALKEQGVFQTLNCEGTLFHDLYVKWSLQEQIEH